MIGSLIVALALGIPPAATAEAFRDCADCPEMVVIPSGSFVMGAPDDEPDRQRWDGPLTKVTIDRPFALAKYETTRRQYAAFMRESRHETPGPCRVFAGTWASSNDANWQRANFPQSDDHPQVCVDWYDTLAFVEWLNTKGGHAYYLPSEAEFEYANRAGATGAFPWGGSRAEICRHANIADRQVKANHPHVEAHDCDDGFEFAAPVGSFPANKFGLYDTFGNVWEWVFDCWAFDHTLSDGTAKPVTQGENCQKRIIKGAGYESVARYARTAARGRDDIPDIRIAVIGFRVAARLN